MLKQNEGKLSDVFHKIDMPLVEILVAMEREGIELDVNYLQNLGEEIDAELKIIEKNIYEIVGHQFNIASPKQVGEVLFGELGLPGGKRTKTKAWQTNERILLNLVNAHPIIPELFKYREYSKIRSTYITSLIEQVNPVTKKIHTSYNQTIATTGRLTSTNPNLQNIPISSELGAKIRKAFVAGNGKKLISFDVSQQELRILAHMSEEPELINAYLNNLDVHTLTASKVFGVGIDEVTKEQRSKGKTLNFSLIYGISAFGLSDRMKISREEAEEMIYAYFKTYPKVQIFFDQLLHEARISGKVKTMFGRWRETSGLTSSNGAVRSATEREVINFPIQGSAADMVKLAMIDCFEFLQSNRLAKELNAKMLLQIHDELIFIIDDASEEKINQFAEEIKNMMQTVVELKVPVKVGFNLGDNWGGLK